MSNFVLIILMAVGGVAVALQPSINARLAEKIGFLEAATVSFVVGTLVLLLISLLTIMVGTWHTVSGTGWCSDSGLHGRGAALLLFRCQ